PQTSARIHRAPSDPGRPAQPTPAAQLRPSGRPEPPSTPEWRPARLSINVSLHSNQQGKHLRATSPCGQVHRQGNFRTRLRRQQRRHRPDVPRLGRQRHRRRAAIRHRIDVGSGHRQPRHHGNSTGPGGQTSLSADQLRETVGTVRGHRQMSRRRAVVTPSVGIGAAVEQQPNLLCAVSPERPDTAFGSAPALSSCPTVERQPRRAARHSAVVSPSSAASSRVSTFMSAMRHHGLGSAPPWISKQPIEAVATVRMFSGLAALFNSNSSTPRQGIPTFRRRVPQRRPAQAVCGIDCNRLAVEQPSHVGHVAKSGYRDEFGGFSHLGRKSRLSKPGASRSEQELIADCTCPVCQELFQHPQRLTACRHTFCKKCAKKMAAKTSNPMEEAAEMSFGLFGMFHHRERQTSAKEKPGSVCCPICRETSEKFEPDETIEYLVKVLQEMRHQSRCSGAESCLTEATLQCPCCDKRFCQSHHAAQLTALKDSGTALLKDLDSLLFEPDQNGDEKLKQLQSAMSESVEIESLLAEQLHRKFADFREQIGLCQSQLQSPLVPDEAERSVLLLDRAVLRQLTSNGASARLARLLPEAKSRAKRAQERWPERRLALQFDAVKMQYDFEGLLAQHASSAVFQSPYEGLPPMLTRVRQQNLSQKPWDIGILSNLEGIVCCDGAIKLRSSVGDSAGSAKELTGPLLVINAQCFPTKMLHVTDLELILTSDASGTESPCSNLEGRTVTSFGEKGLRTSPVSQSSRPQRIWRSNVRCGCQEFEGGQ
uniref:RING-type domain-containing protein n=1 Tax=Macrostomum lignano TaxID=282301 RepID=A0A1I8IED6_9PLAT